MPFAVVEAIGNAGSKKLLAVPDSWIVSENEVTGYLYWPDRKSVGKLIDLIANDCSTPMASWDKQKCKIIYRNISSFKSASKTLEILHKQYKLNASTCRTQRNDLGVPNLQQNITPEREVRKIGAENQQRIASVQEQRNYTDPQQEEDPFGNLPVPKQWPTVQDNATMEHMYSLCTIKKEYGLFGDLCTVTSHSNESLKEAASAEGEEQSDDDMQNLSSRNNRQPAVDPLEAVKHSTELYDLIYELKCIMAKNQEEIKQNIRDSFDRMQDTIVSLIKPNEPMQSNLRHKQTKTVEFDSLHFDVLKTVEDVKRFEGQLGNTEYRKRVRKFVDCITKNEYRARSRMKMIFDRLFDAQLLPLLNWSGKFGKHPLKYSYNITNLFQYIGTSASQQISLSEVASFLSKTIENKIRAQLHSKSAAMTVASVASNNEITVQKTMPNRLLGAETGEMLQQDDTVEEDEQDEMIEEDATGVQEESMEQSLQVATDKSPVDKYVNQITCVEELDSFESQLNDEKVKQLVHKWIEETVGFESNVEKRMVKLLDRLMDNNFLQQTFSWMDANNGKRPLQKYENFVRLFEYASRTMIHQTIIFNHGYVSNFFVKIFTKN